MVVGKPNIIVSCNRFPRVNFHAIVKSFLWHSVYYVYIYIYIYIYI